MCCDLGDENADHLDRIFMRPNADTQVHPGCIFRSVARVMDAFIPRYFVVNGRGLSCRRICLVPPVEEDGQRLWGDRPVDFMDCGGIDLATFTYPNAPIPFPRLERFWSVFVEVVNDAMYEMHPRIALIEAADRGVVDLADEWRRS